MIEIKPYSEEEIEEREYRLEYGILQLEWWRELNEWRQRALEEHCSKKSS